MSERISLMSDKNDLKQELYSNYRDELTARMLSSDEKYAGAILTISSAGLGISIGFIKGVVPLDKAEYIPLLVSSWICFGLAILGTVISFPASKTWLLAMLKDAEEYYINGKKEYLNKKHTSERVTNFLHKFSGFVFVLAIVFIIMFVIFNISKTGNVMAKENKIINNDGKIPDKSTTNNTDIGDGITPAPMQEIPADPPPKPNPTPDQPTEN